MNDPIARLDYADCGKIEGNLTCLCGSLIAFWGYVEYSILDMEGPSLCIKSYRPSNIKDDHPYRWNTGLKEIKCLWCNNIYSLSREVQAILKK